MAPESWGQLAPRFWGQKEASISAMLCSESGNAPHSAFSDTPYSPHSSIINEPCERVSIEPIFLFFGCEKTLVAIIPRIRGISIERDVVGTDDLVVKTDTPSVRK